MTMTLGEQAADIAHRALERNIFLSAPRLVDGYECHYFYANRRWRLASYPQTSS